jgi:hypothetical protein
MLRRIVWKNPEHVFKLFPNLIILLGFGSISNIKNKVAQFRESTKSRKYVFVTMLTTYGVLENANSLDMVQNELTMDCLFVAE